MASMEARGEYFRVTVIDLSTRRAPVWYTIHIGQHWDDTLEFRIEDVGDDDRSRASIADALRRLADQLNPPPHEMKKEDLG